MTPTRLCLDGDSLPVLLSPAAWPLTVTQGGGKRNLQGMQLFLPREWELCAPVQSVPRQSCQGRMGLSTPKSQSKYLWSPRGR